MKLSGKSTRNIERDTRPVVFRLSSLGDVVLTTGVMNHWNRKYGLRFSVITRSEYSAVLKGHPGVESIVGIEDHMLRGTTWFTVARALARRFRNRSLIDLHGSLRSHVLSLCWSGSVYRYPKYALERRLYVKRHSGRLKEFLLSTNIPQRYSLALDEEPPPREEITPLIVLSGEELDRVDSLLGERHISYPFIVLHPYAAHTLKEWPPRYWEELIGLIDTAGIEWVVVGKGSAGFLADIEPARDLSNETDLRTTCAIVKKARAMVSCDSGPVHLADGVSTPVIALYGPTSREWGFYPSGPDAVVIETDLPCRPCSLHGDNTFKCRGECMRSITPRMVFDTLHTVLASAV